MSNTGGLTKTICKMGAVLEQLPSKHSKAVTKAIQDRFNTASFNIEKALWDAGFEVSQRTIDRHRTNRCVCYRQRGETNE